MNMCAGKKVEEKIQENQFLYLLKCTQPLDMLEKKKKNPSKNPFAKVSLQEKFHFHLTCQLRVPWFRWALRNQRVVHISILLDEMQTLFNFYLFSWQLFIQTDNLKGHTPEIIIEIV